jgi:hypothetical protein
MPDVSNERVFGDHCLLQKKRRGTRGPSSRSRNRRTGRKTLAASAIVADRNSHACEIRSRSRAATIRLMSGFCPAASPRSATEFARPRNRPLPNPIRLTGCRYFSGVSMTDLSEHFWSDMMRLSGAAESSSAPPISIQFCMTLYAPDFLLPCRWPLGSMPSQLEPLACRRIRSPAAHLR